MALVNMKTDAQKTILAESPVESKPEYPYGLSINLEDASLAKLGIDKLPEVGGTMMIKARVKVESASIHDGQGGRKKSLSLQITDMELGSEGPVESKDDNAAKLIYIEDS